MTNRWKPHVTVAALMERDGLYLLVEEETAHGLRLNTPAGHLEASESIVDGCVREAWEETAHRFTPDALVGIYMTRNREARAHKGAPQDITYVRFALSGTVGDSDPSQTLDTGIVRTLWMSPAEIEASRDRHRSPMVWQCVQDHMRGQRFDLSVLFTHDSVGDPEVRG